MTIETEKKNLSLSHSLRETNLNFYIDVNLKLMGSLYRSRKKVLGKVKKRVLGDVWGIEENSTKMNLRRKNKEKHRQIRTKRLTHKLCALNSSIF